MANQRTSFRQSDLTKVLKAHLDAGLPAPMIIIEPLKITVRPAASLDDKNGDFKNDWD